MNKNTSVRIRKIGIAATPIIRTASDDVYVPGAFNANLSPPIAYEIEGVLLQDIVIGEALTALRHKRNGVEITGVFETSTVQAIEERPDCLVVKTANSVYEVLDLSPSF